MEYKGTISTGIFKERPNRFIAYVWLEDQLVTAHVKNTGRCKELLLEGARVLLEYAPHKKRKTAYSLIGVYKEERLINIDSQAPNRVVKEALEAGKIPEIGPCNTVKSEFVHGHSRFDFYAETNQGNWLIEVKGVTLEESRVLRFPDAPTERGRRHIVGLTEALKEGLRTMVIFVIQMDHAEAFEPNYTTDPQFAMALEEAHRRGVVILAYTCRVTKTGLELSEPIPVGLKGEQGQGVSV